MISLNDVEVYIGENLLFPTTYTVAKSVKKSHQHNEEEMLSVDMHLMERWKAFYLEKKDITNFYNEI